MDSADLRPDDKNLLLSVSLCTGAMLPHNTAESSLVLARKTGLKMLTKVWPYPICLVSHLGRVSKSKNTPPHRQR